MLALPVAAALVFSLLAMMALFFGGNAEADTDTPAVEDRGQTWELKVSFGFSEEASLYAAHVVPWSTAVEAATGGRVTIKALRERGIGQGRPAI